MEHAPIPVPSQVALAMAIVKHKPADENIKEYILRIRQHIKCSKENNHSYPQDKFFDSVSFWQKAYEKSEAEQSKLLDRIFELERRNEAVVAKLQGQATDVGKDEESSKRKTPAGKNPTAARKRAKTQVNTGELRGLDCIYTVGDNADAQREYSEGSTGPFMRQLYALQKALQRRSNDGEIACFAVILCKTVSCEMSNLHSQKQSASDRSKKVPLQARNPDMPAALQSVERAFQLLCQALKKLLGSNEAGMVVYHVVELYGSTLIALQQECKTTSSQASSNTKAKARMPKPRQSTRLKGVAPTQPTSAQPSPHSALATQIARLLNIMVISLDVNCSGHQSVLEGFLYILLSRVGNLLSLFVFQDLQLQPDLHVGSEKLPTPAALYGFGMDCQSQCAERMEARHVIWLLERMLAVTDTLHDPAPTLVHQQLGTNTLPTSRIKEQLQSTLLQGVFGEGSEWRNALQPPIQPDLKDLDELLSHSRVSEQTTPDWFIQEVWRILGWDMLERKSVQDR